MKLTYDYLFATTVLLFSSHLVYSQALKVGDKMPDIVLKNVWNYDKDELNLADYKEKLVIFDFWSFWCAPCLENLPKIDSLQNEYKDKVQIIWVNRKSKAEVVDFFTKRKRLKVPALTPFITSDTLLDNFFPHDGVPFYVWVQNGKVLYTTNINVSRGVLEKHFKGHIGLFNPPAKNRYVKSIHDADIFPYVKYTTHIIKAIDTLNFHIDQVGSNIPYDARSVQQLYEMAYNESENEAFYRFSEHGRTILEFEDVDQYRKPEGGGSYDLWRGQNGYYYYAILPEWLQDQKFKIMQADLNRYFGLKPSIEIREVKSLALVRTSNLNKINTKGGTPDLTLFEVMYKVKDYDKLNPPIRYLKNQPFQLLVDILKGKGNDKWNLNVVDQTGFTGNIDFQMSEKEVLNDSLDDFRKALQRYGFDLVEKMIPMEVLVLRK
jgi:thiol-disulfide isomerase/thioredoxin